MRADRGGRDRTPRSVNEVLTASAGGVWKRLSQGIWALPPGPVEHPWNPPGSLDRATITIGHELGPLAKVDLFHQLTSEMSTNADFCRT